MADEQDTVVECWAPIPGHPGYEASDQGRIRSVQRWIVEKTGKRRCQQGKLLSPGRLPRGYMIVHLSPYRNLYVHRLVGLTFLGKPPEGMDVCHNNSNPSDNRLGNLRFDTPVGNAEDMIKLGRSTRGERQPNHKLTEQQVREIKKDKYAWSFLAQKYGVSEKTIKDIVIGRRWAWLDAENSEQPP